jgi:hypothetical protein
MYKMKMLEDLRERTCYHSFMIGSRKKVGGNVKKRRRRKREFCPISFSNNNTDLSLLGFTGA